MTGRFALCLVLLFACTATAQMAVPPTEVPEETMRKLLVHRVHPVYPTDEHSEGPVVLRAIIDKKGCVESLQIVSGNPPFVSAALHAVSQWKYRPYDVNGIPVRVETTIRFEFNSDADGVDIAARSLESPETPLRVDGEILLGHIVRRISPIYPPLARQARIQGMVVLKIIVDKLGNVRDVQLVSGHPMLAPAAIAAITQWKYYPYDVDGETFEIETSVQVNFTLAGS